MKTFRELEHTRLDKKLDEASTNFEKQILLDQRNQINIEYDNIRKQIIKKIILKEYQAGLIWTDLKKYDDEVTKILIDKKSKQKKSTSKKVKDTHFITLNFKPLEEKDKKIIPDIIRDGLNDCKYIKNYRYCIEQRGKNPQSVGLGVHSHIIMTTTPNVRPESIRKSLYKKFSAYMSDKAKVDTQKIKTEKDERHFDDYILGIKQNTKEDPDKKLKAKIDIIFRKKYNFELIYKKST